MFQLSALLQARLLELSELDTQIAQKRAVIRNHALHLQIQDVEKQCAHIRQKIAECEAENAVQLQQMDTLETEIAVLTEKVSVKTTQMQQGTGLVSRDLLALQTEIAQANTKISELSETALTHLLAAEAETETKNVYEAELNTLSAQLADLRQELGQVLADTENEITQLLQNRAELSADLPQELLDYYAKAREQGSLGVIGVYADGQTTSGLQLSAVEISQILAQPELVIFSEEHNCLIVHK